MAGRKVIPQPPQIQTKHAEHLPRTWREQPRTKADERGPRNPGRRLCSQQTPVPKTRGGGAPPPGGFNISMFIIKSLRLFYRTIIINRFRLIWYLYSIHTVSLYEPFYFCSNKNKTSGRFHWIIYLFPGAGFSRLRRPAGVLVKIMEFSQNPLKQG